MRRVVISEFRKRKKRLPVVLLIIAKYPQVLFGSLVCSFCLSVTFGMVSRGVVEVHIECFFEQAEKSRDGFGITVGSDMFGNTMF